MGETTSVYVIGASEESPLESAAAITVGVAGAGSPPSSCVLPTSMYDLFVAFGAMVSVYVLPMPVQPFASVTFTVIEKTPVWVGVPERTPLDESETPDGSEPLLMEKTAGPWGPTPLCVKVKLPLSGRL